MGYRILFAGGGTGGHIYPALAIAEEFKRRYADFEPLFVGTRAGLESKVIGESDFTVRFIFSRGARGRGIPGKALTLASLLVGFFQSMKILSEFKPDLVLGSGGYASAAAVLAASALNYLVVLQEQNSIPGLTNRLLASKARRIYLGFERAAAHFKTPGKVIVTGNPLRREIVLDPQGSPHEVFGLDGDRPVLLVFGGSQGAHNLNRAAIEYVKSHTMMQAIIQTGERDYEWVRRELSGCADRIYISPYISEINHAYRAATMALARAGALSVSELAAVHVPTIFVPYPHAADDHQRFNAEELVAAGGAVVIDDAELNGESLAGLIDQLLARGGSRLAEMRSALERIARLDADMRICDDMVSILKERRGRSEPSGGRASEQVG